MSNDFVRINDGLTGAGSIDENRDITEVDSSETKRNDTASDNVDMKRDNSNIENAETKRDKYAAQKKYDANNTVQKKFKLNINTDADILAYLDSCDNVQGLIKALLRERMTKDGFTAS